MKITDEKIEDLLKSQAWIEPSADFRQNVMSRIAIERAAQLAPSSSRRWYERALTAVPAVLIVVLLIQNARYLGGLAMEYLRDAGFWLGSTTGWPVFAAYPIILLGIAAPILAGAVASCALSSHCRLTRALIS